MSFHEGTMPVKYLIGFSSLFLAACASSSPVLQPTSLPTAPAPVAESPAQPSWTFVRDGIPRAYVSTTNATFEQQSNPTRAANSTSATTEFTLAFQGDDLSRFQVTVERLSYSGGARPDRNTSGLVFPLVFTGSHLDGKPVFDSASLSALTGCTNPAHTTFFTVTRNLIVMPMELTQGATWSDSTVLSGCSGSIPVQLTVTRAYTISGQAEHNGRAVLVIDQIGRVTSAGEGAEGQHRVFLQSRGTESGRLYLEPVSGFLLEAETEQTSTVTVTTSGRSQIFVQKVHERVERR